MKLRNKTTGEIKECVVIPIDSNGYPNEYQEFEKSDSLSELNEEWEDAPEKPKEYWYIGDNGEVYGFSNYYVGSEVEEEHRIIGNLFKTREEAKKAAEKLKAVKRLKDKGFRFDMWKNNKTKYLGDFIIYAQIKDLTDIADDLDLLFGGENER